MTDTTNLDYGERLGLSRTVYSRVWPESAAVLDELWASRPHHLYEDAHTGWQDEYHEAFLQAWKTWAAPVLELPDEFFPRAYATAGASQAIGESLALYAARGGRRIHVFEGEYEGYAAQAAGYRIDTQTHDRSLFARSLAPGGADAPKPGERFYLSAPSAIDGNVWPGLRRFLDYMLARHPEVDIFLDATYLGLTANLDPVVLTWPNVHSVFFSLSKPFGVYYHRIGGVFTRQEYPSLYGTRWFKNMFSLALGTTLLERSAGPIVSPERIQEQHAACAVISAEAGVTLRPSDVILLAHLMPDDSSPAWTRGFVRGSGHEATARFCLTPYFNRGS